MFPSIYQHNLTTLCIYLTNARPTAFSENISLKLNQELMPHDWTSWPYHMDVNTSYKYLISYYGQF